MRIISSSASRIKRELFALCQAFIDERIAVAKEAIQMAQASANDETKSSAGDKYETGRAMAQLEIEKGSSQLAEAMKMKSALSQVQPDRSSPDVQVGSVVITNQGNYFISISAGKLMAEGTEYIAISSVSPVGTLLMKREKGASLIFNQKKFFIEEIY